MFPFPWAPRWASLFWPVRAAHPGADPARGRRIRSVFHRVSIRGHQPDAAQILLTLEATVRLVIPNGVEEVAVSSQMAVAESIIVGLVPDSFVDVNNDSEMLNLIP